jgi:hypothetical protein
MISAKSLQCQPTIKVQDAILAVPDVEYMKKKIV